nr:PREDICTED: pupal cuticle protein C1B-like [Linepithema humile]
MKCFAVVVLLALVATVALAKPTGVEESIEPAQAEPISPEAARNKRGLLLSAAYTAPIAYSAYTAPVAYSAYSYPYAYTAYSGYPYYAASYSAPYYLA